MRSSRSLPLISLIVAAIVGQVLCAQTSFATTLRHMDTRELTTSSDAIVLGEVTQVRSEWEAGRRRIVTRVTLRVDESLKGGGAQSVEIVQLGGEVDGVKVTVAGCPAFRVGEEALLFLSGDTPTRLQVTGLAQGKFDITRDPKTGRVFVGRTTPGLATRDAQRLRPAPGDAGSHMSLNALLAEVRKHVGGEGR